MSWKLVYRIGVPNLLSEACGPLARPSTSMAYSNFRIAVFASVQMPDMLDLRLNFSLFRFRSFNLSTALRNTIPSPHRRTSRLRPLSFTPLSPLSRSSLRRTRRLQISHNARGFPAECTKSSLVFECPDSLAQSRV